MPGVMGTHTKGASEHVEEQQESGGGRDTVSQVYAHGGLQVLPSVHVYDIKCPAAKEVAQSLLQHLNDKVGQCKAHYGSSSHIGMQHESQTGAVLIHHYVYIDSITPIDVGLFFGKGEGAECGPQLHEACRFVLGAVAWTVLTRIELAVYVQALQRRAHAHHIKDCKRLNIVIRYMHGHKCGFKPVRLQHPLKLVAFTDAAFKAQREEPIGLALRGLAANLCEDRFGGARAKYPHGDNGKVAFTYSIARRQRRGVRINILRRTQWNGAQC